MQGFSVDARPGLFRVITGVIPNSGPTVCPRGAEDESGYSSNGAARTSRGSPR
jgi:hypothetical protein